MLASEHFGIAQSQDKSWQTKHAVGGHPRDPVICRALPQPRTLRWRASESARSLYPARRRTMFASDNPTQQSVQEPTAALAATAVYPGH
eukprot:scaffold254473_cov32-Tisochrysis_lutea.AAC.4